MSENAMAETTMQAMEYRSYGGVEKLEQLEPPIPKIGPGSVRIKIKAAGVLTIRRVALSRRSCIPTRPRVKEVCCAESLRDTYRELTR